MQIKGFFSLIRRHVNLVGFSGSSQSNGSKGLGFASCKQSRSVGGRQIIHLAPDRSYFIGFSSVQAQTFIKGKVAYGSFFRSIVILRDQGTFFFQFLFGEGGFQFFLDCGKGVGTIVFGRCRVGHCVNFVIHHLADFLFQVFVFGSRFIFAHFFASHGICQSHLGLALFFDMLMRKFDGFHHFLFRNFFHFAFHHHYRIHGSTYYHIDIRFLQLRSGRVDDKLAVDPSHAGFGNGTFKWQVGKLNSRRCCQSCHGIGHYIFIMAHQLDHHLCFGVIIFWEQRSQNAVYQSHGQYFSVTGSGFSFKESARISTGSGKFFAIIYR